MYYMTKLGWPVKSVETESSWGDKVPYIYFSDSVAIRLYTGDCIFSRQGSFNYVEGWDVPFKEFYKDFFTLYGGRKAYFKGKLYYEFFEVPQHLLHWWLLLPWEGVLDRSAWGE